MILVHVVHVITLSFDETFRNLDGYGKATECIGNINRKCLNLTDTVPTADKIKKWQEYACANKDSEYSVIVNH